MQSEPTLLPVRKLISSFSWPGWVSGTPGTAGLCLCLRNMGQYWLPLSPPTRRMCVTGAERQTDCWLSLHSSHDVSVGGAAPFARLI